MKQRIVLSGVNFVEAGPLSIFQDALEVLAQHFLDRYEVVALVHRKSFFDTPGITYLEFPEVKASWLRRLRFEYWDCRALSRKLQPQLWLAMHDITPNVVAPIRAVYCHNPAPFYRPRFCEALSDWKLALFSLFYRYLYRIHIGKNDFVIVQQQWLREEFRRRYPVRKLVVARPSVAHIADRTGPESAASGPYIFFFPAFPRSFKNIELLLRAAQLLEKQGISGFEVWLTISGEENRYAASLHRKFGKTVSVRWLGLQTREAVLQLYGRAHCLVFPSRLESWGMPLSEFKQTGKPILAADLPYAHETVGSYDNVAFVSPTDPHTLATAMQELVQGTYVPQQSLAAEVAAPFAEDWRELFDLLLAQQASANGLPGGD